ncbi:MAG: hypothetical protein IPM39_27860 [Chloroflexi bacterium]|nr:hypothetical protein [Chloroflexota bacterium]
MSTESRMKAVLDELDFDFSEFTMDGFVAWIESRIRRKIRFRAWPMPPGMFGVWVSDAEELVEHIFYDDTGPLIQQVHIQLHELSHIICSHPTACLTGSQMRSLLLQSAEDPTVLSHVLLRAPAKDGIEEEAEILASLIQHQVINNKRIKQLAITASSNDDLSDHFKSLGLV